MATRVYINEIARICRVLSRGSRVSVLLVMEYGHKHSVTSIYEETKMNRRTIRDSLTALERAGFIRRVPDKTKIRWFEPVDPKLAEIIRGLVMRN